MDSDLLTDILSCIPSLQERKERRAASANSGTKLLRALAQHDGSPIDLFVDNKSAIDLAYNPEHHQRTKHVNRRHFCVRELVEDLTIRVPFHE